MHEGPLVVFSGGGTGGHLYPALAIADALRERRPDVRPMFFGAQRGLEARVLPARGERHVLLPVHGVDRSRPARSWRALTGLLGSLARVAGVFARERPELVVVTGGYAGAPAGVVAALSGVPLVLQEQNSVPGVVTKLLTRWADRVYLAYPEAEARLPLTPRRVRFVGNPVQSAATADRASVRGSYGVPMDAMLVLVIGGSQGSLALNRVVSEALQAWGDDRVERPGSLHLVWCTGPAHARSVEALVESCGSPEWVHVTPYVEDIPSTLAAADLAVSRAGAMSTAELLSAGLPGILVPLPSAAEGHQMQNARALEAAGAMVVEPEDGLSGAALWGRVLDLLDQAETLKSMREAALSLARPDAARRIAEDLDGMLVEAAR